MIKDVILATNNVGKIGEFTALLQPLSFIPQAQLNIPDAEETGLSFVENALIKARHAAQLGERPALADDSGLVVPALNGAPGIYSARFAKRNQSELDNNQYLLQRLKGFGMASRRAYFYCAIALVEHAFDPTPLIVTGKWEGYIALEAQGEDGFGYDPLFYLPALQCTVAQLLPAQKNKLSHRGLAMAALKRQILSESRRLN
jgi:XTP/dITP diphosphohydrolase